MPHGSVCWCCLLVWLRVGCDTSTLYAAFCVVFADAPLSRPICPKRWSARCIGLAAECSTSSSSTPLTDCTSALLSLLLLHRLLSTAALARSRSLAAFTSEDMQDGPSEFVPALAGIHRTIPPNTAPGSGELCPRKRDSVVFVFHSVSFICCINRYLLVDCIARLLLSRAVLLTVQRRDRCKTISVLILHPPRLSMPTPMLVPITPPLFLRVCHTTRESGQENKATASAPATPGY